LYFETAGLGATKIKALEQELENVKEDQEAQTQTRIAAQLLLEAQQLQQAASEVTSTKMKALEQELEDAKEQQEAQTRMTAQLQLEAQQLEQAAWKVATASELASTRMQQDLQDEVHKGQALYFETAELGATKLKALEQEIATTRAGSIERCWFTQYVV
jgi:hypothetical protein